MELCGAENGVIAGDAGLKFAILLGAREGILKGDFAGIGPGEEAVGDTHLFDVLGGDGGDDRTNLL